ncbi:hypothetical protein JD969_16060 [Planctomycetota bacterium]|nr:hypothetical protein JD969_16060 [Planctomycetota bacterium]
MGLEDVELIMEVENYFGIKISDAEAGQVKTVGDLCDLIKKHVGKVIEEKVIVAVGYRCKGCDYSLKSLPQRGKCPECGLAYCCVEEIETVVVKIIRDLFFVSKKEVITRETDFRRDLKFG